MSLKSLINHKHWVFDMDGTLTIAQHDFDAIRSELGVPEGQTILESLQELPEEESAPLHKLLNEIELELAHQAQPAEGAKELLEKLISQGANIGILTRNNALNIGVTLKAAGLAHYFSPDNLLSRDCIKPKPAPDGILALLRAPLLIMCSFCKTTRHHILGALCRECLLPLQEEQQRR